MSKLKPFEMDCSRENVRNAMIKTIKQGEICDDKSSRARYYFRGQSCTIGHMFDPETARKLDRKTHQWVGNNYCISDLIQHRKVIPVGEFKDLDFSEIQSIHDSVSHLSSSDIVKNLWLKKFNAFLKANRIRQITKKEIQND